MYGQGYGRGGGFYTGQRYPNYNQLSQGYRFPAPMPLVTPVVFAPYQNYEHQQRMLNRRNNFQDNSLVYSQNTGNKRSFSNRNQDEPYRKKQRLQDTNVAPHKPLGDSMNDKVTGGIWRYYENYRQTDEIYKSKVDLRDALYAIFKGIFPYCGLYMVGSSMSGFATKTSDMDLCLMISPQQMNGKKESVEILMAIQKSLRRCSFIRQLQVIKARVPILKFKDSRSHVECDLNINNSVGIRNTHLLRYYAAMDWRVRPLVLFVKKWARFHDINDASKKTISSYSLCLMLIHYLQSGCSPPVLVSVQKLYPDLFDYNGDIRNLKMNVRIEYKSQNSQSLGDLFLGFLEYYTKRFNFVFDVASVRQGSRLPIHLVKATNVYDPQMWTCLKIEEPFDQSNTARSCYDPKVFSRVTRVIAKSYHTLSVKRQVDSIMSTPF